MARETWPAMLMITSSPAPDSASSVTSVCGLTSRIATTVVGGDSGYSGGRSVRLEQLPNNLFTHAGTLRLAGEVHGAEDVSVSDAGGGRPRIGRHLHPTRHRNRPYSSRS